MSLERSILAVDDDPRIRRVMERALRDEGYRLVTAASAYEALDHLRRDATVSIAFLDMHMPGESGMDLARRIRRGDAGPFHKTLPLVFVTSDESELKFEESFEVGAHGYLPKPFQMQDILEQIRTIFVTPFLPTAEAE